MAEFLEESSRLLAELGCNLTEMSEGLSRHCPVK